VVKWRVVGVLLARNCIVTRSRACGGEEKYGAKHDAVAALVTRSLLPA
jgi:hypothetical protein